MAAPNFLFKIGNFNVEGLFPPKIEQLYDISLRHGLNVLVLTETHGRPRSHGQDSNIRSLMLKFGWNFHHSGCGCKPNYSHGVSILVHPAITCTMSCVVQNVPEQGGNDHRQMAASLTLDGYTCHLVGFHYQSGTKLGPKSPKGAQKVLQLKATIAHFEKLRSFTDRSIWVAVGDANIKPTHDPMFGQFQKSFEELEMKVESYLQLGTVAQGKKTFPPTRVAPNPNHSNNMLDYAVVRKPSGIECRVELENDPPIQSDHSQYLVVTIGRSEDVQPQPRITNWFSPRHCIQCGQGFSKTPHNPCPCIDIPALVQQSKTKAQTRQGLSMSSRAVQAREYRQRKKAGVVFIRGSLKKPDHLVTPGALKSRLSRQRKKAGIVVSRFGQRKPDNIVAPSTLKKRAQLQRRRAGVPLPRGGQRKPDHLVAASTPSVRAHMERKKAGVGPLPRGSQRKSDHLVTASTLKKRAYLDRKKASAVVPLI